MDDRKKQIIELERRKREQGVSLDALLVRFGEALLGRVPDSFEQESFGEIAVYRKLRKNIADSEAAIQAVEELICRFREIEESIEDKEREDTACSRELAVMYGKLGKILLDSPSDDAGFCAPYRDQANALTTKVLSLEERLSGLEGTESGNVFTWIGKGAQSLVLRSFLTKAQDNLEQLRRNVGERYSRWKTVKLPGAETGDETVSYGGIAEAT
ncbi:MAG: hypothetical protein FWD36_04420 [Treponema sp.]|nr:hypothetical protein [Treponema sp.]